MRLIAAARMIGSTLLVGLGAGIATAVAYFLIEAQQTPLSFRWWDDYVVVIALLALILMPAGWLTALLMRASFSLPIAKTLGSRVAFGMVCVALFSIIFLAILGRTVPAVYWMRAWYLPMLCSTLAAIWSLRRHGTLGGKGF